MQHLFSAIIIHENHAQESCLSSWRQKWKYTSGNVKSPLFIKNNPVMSDHRIFLSLKWTEFQKPIAHVPSSSDGEPFSSKHHKTSLKQTRNVTISTRPAWNRLGTSWHSWVVEVELGMEIGLDLHHEQRRKRNAFKFPSTGNKFKRSDRISSKIQKLKEDPTCTKIW